MKDYISREAAIKIIREQGIYGSGYSDTEREDDVVQMLESVPASNVAPVVEGEWINQYGGEYANALYKCSVCGETAHDKDGKRWILTPFCPNCGAKMKGGGNNG